MKSWESQTAAPITARERDHEQAHSGGSGGGAAAGGPVEAVAGDSSEDRVWAQIYPMGVRADTLRVPLQELHDPASGRLDAARVAEYLKVPLKSLAEAVGKNYSTIHKTPAAPDVQPFLQSIKTSLVILEDVLGNHSAVLAWLNHPHPNLGQTPLDVILQGYPDAVKHMLQAAIIGTPS
jgi:antitoxin Xre/MbcA/ParS-like protein